jgi:hypothetical protein
MSEYGMDFLTSRVMENFDNLENDCWSEWRAFNKIN